MLCGVWSSVGARTKPSEIGSGSALLTTQVVTLYRVSRVICASLFPCFRVLSQIRFRMGSRTNTCESLCRMGDATLPVSYAHLHWAHEVQGISLVFNENSLLANTLEDASFHGQHTSHPLVGGEWVCVWMCAWRWGFLTKHCGHVRGHKLCPIQLQQLCVLLHCLPFACPVHFSGRRIWRRHQFVAKDAQKEADPLTCAAEPR